MRKRSWPCGVVLLVLAARRVRRLGQEATADAELQTEADIYADRPDREDVAQGRVDARRRPDDDDLGARRHVHVGGETLVGQGGRSATSSHAAGPFQPQNHWVSDTPAYKIRTTVNGDKGTLYFECHYVDVKTGKVASVVGADQDVQKIDGKWLITSSSPRRPTLGP